MILAIHKDMGYLKKTLSYMNCYNTEKMQINSLHHQAIKKVAKGFKVVAKSEDGIVEGIENKNIIAILSRRNKSSLTTSKNDF